MTERDALKLARTALGVQLDALLGKAGHLRNDDRRRYAENGIKAIDEVLAQPEQEKQFVKVFSQMKLENEPCSEVLALGQMMREWLQHQVSDNGSCVDTGKGFSEYDLWVMCEGKELLITIKEKK